MEKIDASLPLEAHIMLPQQILCDEVSNSRFVEVIRITGQEVVEKVARALNSAGFTPYTPATSSSLEHAGFHIIVVEAAEQEQLHILHRPESDDEHEHVAKYLATIQFVPELAQLQCWIETPEEEVIVELPTPEDTPA